MIHPACHTRNVILALLISACIFVPAAHCQRQLSEPSFVPENLSDGQRKELESLRATLVSRLGGLLSTIDQHKQRCSYVQVDSPLARECQAKMQEIGQEITNYTKAEEDFESQVNAAVSAYVGDISRRLKQITVPPPIEPELASIQFGELPNDRTSKRVFLGLEAGVAVVAVTERISGIVCPYCKLILATGHVVIDAENAADIYLTRQNDTYELALRFLKDPATRVQFTAIVHALKEGSPAPTDSRADMLRAAKAMLDPKLGSSNMRIAWDALWSPDAKQAILTRAAIELGGAILGEASSRAAKSLMLARDPAMQAAEEYLTTARKVREVATDPDALVAIRDAMAESQEIIAQSYRQAKAVGEASGEAVSIFSKWAAEEHVTQNRQ
jgi:hypothetical protein